MAISISLSWFQFGILENTQSIVKIFLKLLEMRNLMILGLFYLLQLIEQLV